MANPHEISQALSLTHDHNYDIFLSFRGIDTRHNFTNHLHKALLDANIETFLDKVIAYGEDLRPELETAIRSSRASIVVFSENYASSRWCLNELVWILEQQKNSDHRIIPVFYHVNPTDIKNLRGSFGYAFAKHRQKIEDERNPEIRSQLVSKMELWREALVKVADLKGHAVDDKKLETELIDEIIEDIYSRLGVLLMSKPPNLIGMEHHICLISSWLKDGSTHPADILTIYGMGGIGKTSLAKLIYSLYRCQFQRSSFIEDINRNSKKLLSFQKQLCANISRTSSVEVSDISAYTCTIEKVLSSKKVLLVLDDVDDLDQLKNLLGNKGFHNGSKIIITSRDASLTKKLKLDVQPKRTMCLLEGLSFESSLELFSLHAFTCKSVKKGYEEMTKKLVNYCDGHPQALIVMGRNLWDRSQAAWKEYIDGLNEETDSRIRKQLQMSFESLQNNDKELFMHIACFFAGKDRVFAETILHECDIGTLNGIKNLVDRCLLTIGPRNELKMHQLLQDMGKDFVRKEHLRPWRRSRIWSHKEFFEVLRKKKDKGTLKGIILDCSVGGEDTTHGSLEVEMDVLRTMDSLDLLQLNHVKFKGSYNFPKNLRWLCIHGFPSRSLPSVPMGNLVVLDMTNSKIESFDLSNSVKSFQWLAGKKTKLLGSCSKDEWSLGSLKILNLSFCYQLRSLQDFSKLPALERLILAGCRSLVEISKSIDKCTELVVVDLSYCIMLKKLPTTLSNLKNLEALSLDGCNLDKSSLEDLQKIINLNTSLQASSSDSKVPHVMSSKICLATSLNYKPSECDSWREESYPMACSSLAMSDALTLDGNPIVILPNGVRSLRRIELLSYEEHDMLKKIKHPTCTRRNLKFSRWDLLTNLYDPNVSPITKALSIYLEAQSLPEIKGVVQLQPIADVEDLIYGLDWKDFDLIKNKKLLFEFGIFSTFYGGKEMPKWIRDRNNGPSINFIVPSSSKNLRGLNFCYLQTGRDPDNGVNLPTVKVRNETKNCTWIYKQYIHWVKVDEKCLIWLSHWMFGKKEMENGNHITISIPPEDNVSIRECGISFVYDDGTMQEDVLGDYKKWDHIIGRDLSPFCLTTKEYFLDNHRFFWWHIDCPVNRPFIKNGACYEEEGVYYRAIPQEKVDMVCGSLVDKA